jgi:flagellar biosynthesis protein FlhA
MQVLRTLLHEQVPIIDLETILQNFNLHNAVNDDPSAISEIIRLALKPSLPGNDGRHRILSLSAELEEMIEQGIRRNRGKSFLALDPNDTQDLLSAIRYATLDHPLSQTAVVVQREGLRPFVRRLLDLEFEALKLLSGEELLPEWKNNIAGEIEL